MAYDDTSVAVMNTSLSAYESCFELGNNWYDTRDLVLLLQQLTSLSFTFSLLAHVLFNGSPLLVQFKTNTSINDLRLRIITGYDSVVSGTIYGPVRVMHARLDGDPIVTDGKF